MSVFGIHAAVAGLGQDGARAEAGMERLNEAGFALLELPLSRASDREPKRLRDAAERLGLGLFASLPGLPLALDALGAPQDALDFLLSLFPVCAEAGSFGLGGIVFDAPGRGSGRAATGKEIDGLSRFLERAARAARGFGLKLAVMPGSRFETHLLNRAAEAAWMVERIGAENLFVQLDTSAMNVEEEGWAPAFEAAAPFLGMVGLCEANRGVPGRGLLDWPAVFKALAETGTACPLVWRGRPLGEIAAGRATGPRPEESADELLDAGAAFLRAKAAEAGVALRR